jgi:Zn-dependent protease with chaperone function
MRKAVVSYAKARLLLGICGVGIFVVSASIALAMQLPTTWAADRSDTRAFAVALGLYVAISAPLDWIGGYFVPKAYRLRTDSAGNFGVRWARAVLTQTAIMGLCLAAILAAGRAGGLAAAAVSFTICMAGLAALQAPLARIVSRLRDAGAEPSPYEQELPARRYAYTDPGFTGGVVGPPGKEALVIPADWHAQLQPHHLQAVLFRRKHAAKSHARVLGIIAATAWNLSGFLLVASLVPGAGVTSAGELLTLALGLGIWSFLGLLTLPTPSRNAVLAIDQETAAERAIGPDTLKNALQNLHDLQHDELRRGEWIETIFHPIPSLESRIKWLEHRAAPTARPWNCARMALFLSWACFGFLSRTVHCNVGLPDMWVLLPSD